MEQYTYTIKVDLWRVFTPFLCNDVNKSTDLILNFLWTHALIVIHVFFTYHLAQESSFTF